jgi:hypothetical protein
MKIKVTIIIILLIFLKNGIQAPPYYIWGWYKFNNNLNNEKSTPNLTNTGQALTYVPGRYNGYAVKLDSVGYHPLSVILDNSFDNVFSFSFFVLRNFIK